MSDNPLPVVRPGDLISGNGFYGSRANLVSESSIILENGSRICRKTQYFVVHRTIGGKLVYLFTNKGDNHA